MSFLPLSDSGVGWLKARGQAPSDRGESREEEERGNDADATDEARARHRRVGADQDGDRSPPAHQRSGLQLETEAQIPGRLLVEWTSPLGWALLHELEQKSFTWKSIAVSCSVQRTERDTAVKVM